MKGSIARVQKTAAASTAKAAAADAGPPSIVDEQRQHKPRLQKTAAAASDAKVAAADAGQPSTADVQRQHKPEGQKTAAAASDGNAAQRADAGQHKTAIVQQQYKPKGQTTAAAASGADAAKADAGQPSTAIVQQQYDRAAARARQPNSGGKEEGELHFEPRSIRVQVGPQRRDVVEHMMWPPAQAISESGTAFRWYKEDTYDNLRRALEQGDPLVVWTDAFIEGSKYPLRGRFMLAVAANDHPIVVASRGRPPMATAKAEVSGGVRTREKLYCTPLIVKTDV